MKHLAVAILGLGLAGCNAGAGGGPDLRAQVQAQPSLAPAWQRYTGDLEAARLHKMTYAQAVAHFRDGATTTPGVRLTGPDQVLISYMAALAVEVDAHRMTPEMMAFRVQEKLTQNHTEQQQANEERNRVDTATRLQALQAYSTFLNATRPAPIVEAPPVAWPTPPMIGGGRLQTTCTTMPIGAGFSSTNCN